MLVFRGVLLIWTSWEEKKHLVKCVSLSTSVKKKEKKQFIFRLSSSSNSPCQWSKFRCLNTAIFERPLDWMLILGGKAFDHLGVVRKYTSKSAKKLNTSFCSSPIFGGEVKTKFENFTQKKEGATRKLAFRQDVGKIHQTLGNLPTIQGIEVFLLLKNKSGGGWNRNHDGCWTIVESMSGLFVFFWKWGIGCWGSFQAVGNGRRKCAKNRWNKAKKTTGKKFGWGLYPLPAGN